MSLEARAWLSLGVLAVVMALLLFVPAGTVRFWQGWAYLSIFFGAAAVATRYLMRHDRALLERRMKGGPNGETRDHALRVGGLRRAARRAGVRSPA